MIRLVLGLLVTLAVVVGSNRLGYEYIYNYRGVVQTTVQKPIVSESNFMIHANIHVQGLDTGDLIFLDNVTYTLYTGKTDDSKVVTNVVDAPVEAQNIKLPFFVERGKSINSIFTQTHDELWSINMKKAIASLFELNNDGINWEKKKPYSFYSDEKSVYGTCKAFYNVIPTNGSHSVVRKHLTPSACKDFKWEVFFNIGDLPQCETSFEEPISISSDRTYNIVKDGTELIINNIQSIGTFLFYPFNGKGDSHSVLVKQSIILDETRQLNDIQKVDMSQMTQHEIGEFLYSQHQTEDNILDLTLSRGKIDMKTLLPQIMKTLKDIKEYSYDIHVTLTSPDIERGQSINTLLTYLRMLNMENLELFFKDVEDKESQKIFVYILPHVGTQSSSILMLKLIKTKQVEYQDIINSLRDMPFHIRIPNVELLSDLFEMYPLESDDGDIKETALLSFATIISKALKYYPEKENKISTFINYYINGFKNATEYDVQILFMSALHNIGGKRVNQFLEQIIQNQLLEFPTSHGLRVRAMWAAKQEYTKNFELLDKIYWPILTDPTEHLEVRSAALSIVMSRPSMEQLSKLSQFMETEDNGDLYNLFYTTLKTLSLSTSPCLQLYSKRAREILQFTRSPVKSTEGASSEQFDYIDPIYGFGAVFKINQIGNLKTSGRTTFYLQFSSQVANLKLNSYSAYIVIRASKEVTDNIFSSVELHNIEELYSALRRISYSGQKDVHVEIVILHFNKAIFSKYYNGNNLMHILYSYGPMDLLRGPFLDSLYSCEQTVEGEAMIPNDMGIPTLFFIRMPEVHKIHRGINTDKNREDIYKLTQSEQITWTQWNHQVYGLSTYNPIADLWHGSRRVLTLDARFAVAIDLILSMRNTFLKIALNAQEDPHFSNIGFQVHAQSQVFVFNPNENSVVTEACPKCKSVVTVTKGEEFRRQYVIWEKDVEETGMNYKLAIFDCERQYTPARLLEIQNHISDTKSKNWGDITLLKYGLMARHLWDYWTTSPVVGSCGLGFLISPSKRYPSSHIEINFSVDPVSNGIPLDKIPANEIHVWSTYNLTHNDSTIRNWKFHIQVETDKREFKGIKIDLTRKVANINDYKICANMSELWMDQLFTRDWEIEAGETTSDLCPTNETSISILVKGEPSIEQKEMNGSTNYPECEEKKTCFNSESDLRHYEYNIKYENLSPGLYEFWTTVSDWLKMIYSDYFIRSYDLEHVGTNRMRISLNYPLKSTDVNVSIVTDDYHYRYVELPLKYWYWKGVIKPLTTHHFFLSSLRHANGNIQACEFSTEYVLNHANIRTPTVLSEEWTLYAADCPGDKCKWQIFAKKTNGKKPMGLRILTEESNLDIISDAGEFQFFNDNKMFKPPDVGQFDGVQFMRVKENYKIILFIPKEEISIDFNGQLVYLHLINTSTLTGECSKNLPIKG